MHQATQAAVERHEASAAAYADHSNKLSTNELRVMLEDFIQLHKRMLSVVVGHELASIRGSEDFPPMDVRVECVRFSLKLRDLNTSPASVFQYMGGILSCSLEGMPAELRQRVAMHNAKLYQTNFDPASVVTGFSSISAICGSAKSLSNNLRS